MLEEDRGPLPRSAAGPAPNSTPEAIVPEVTNRADEDLKNKTTMPKMHAGYKLPSSALLNRPAEQFAVDEDELKSLARVLTEKCAEFDVRGQITQINPGPGGHYV